MNWFLAKWSGTEEDEATIAVQANEVDCDHLMADIGNLSMSEFANAGLVIKLRSALLDGQIIAFVSNNATTAENDLVTYRASELALLGPDAKTYRESKFGSIAAA